MELTLRPMTETERMYSYTQSRQIMSHTGCIGHLRAYLDNNEIGFYSSWDDHREDLKTDAFKAEFDEVIKTLRFDKQYNGMLENRTGLEKFCYAKPESAFGNDREFGFRADTEKFSYMFRLNPNKGEYNIYCYCYRRDWLTYHLDCASRGIRFIDSDYNELFRIPDGGKIRVTYLGGEKAEHTCRYIDDYHVEVGSGNCNLFHVGEYAKRMAMRGAIIEPVISSPEHSKTQMRMERSEAR